MRLRRNKERNKKKKKNNNPHKSKMKTWSELAGVEMAVM